MRLDDCALSVIFIESQIKMMQKIGNQKTEKDLMLSRNDIITIAAARGLRQNPYWVDAKSGINKRSAF